MSGSSWLVPRFLGEPIEKVAPAVAGLSPPAWSSEHSPLPLRKWFLAFCLSVVSLHSEFQDLGYSV